MAGDGESGRPYAVVLDSSALLALLRDERGAEEVEGAIAEGAAISAVNWAEVLSKLVDFGYTAAEAERALAVAGVLGESLEIVSFDSEMASEVATLRDVTRSRGLSLGDRACLALARSVSAPALTADQAWRQLELGIEIRLVR